MRKVPLAGLLAPLLASFLIFPAFADPTVPHLLLNSKLLRRLKRDRDRQTIRWTGFENRVKNVPDSPERGFELALYYAITGNEARAHEAISWAAAHPCERRQRSLIQDWVGTLAPLPCSVQASSLRDQAFEQISAGADISATTEKARQELVPRLASNGVTNSADLYALVELLTALRDSGREDIRNAAPQFFRHLPVEFLLSLKPDQVEKPNWMTHIAALALVSVDPNLESSQFLQGWAMEDRQTLHDGPGVAYEFLWADPYLPGIAYQNLDPWIYDLEGSRLFARTNWNSDACWIGVSTAGVKEINCPAGWGNKPFQFGSMLLVPMTPKCLEFPRQDDRQNLMVWKLTPGEALTFHEKKDMPARADSSGLWRPSANVEGKVCRR